MFTIFSLNKSFSTMAGKKKRGSVGVVCSVKLKFFHPSAPLREKMGKATIDRECFNGVTITGECCCVFSCCSNKCYGYKCTNPDFPGITFQISKHHVLVEQENKTSFESEVEPTLPPKAKAPAVTTMATTLSTASHQDGDENENGDQFLCWS